MTDSLVFVGKIVEMSPIPSADFIVSATVVCGSGGKWRGVVRTADFDLGDNCVVYLPDAQIPESEGMKFMAASNWRVKMRRFKGAPSEVVIMPCTKILDVGDDLTLWFGVTKYHKPVPAHLQGIAKDNFPSFIPKTDEPNYQREGDLVDMLVGKPYYITEKCDGSSTTAYKYKGVFGLCSRNLELERNPDNGYWKVAIKYGIEEKLPDGYAIQWETCGPGIQSNPMGLSEIDGFAFGAYNIEEHRYLDMYDLLRLVENIGIPVCRIVTMKQEFCKEDIDTLGEGLYSNGSQREGVVVRSQQNFGGKPISFKVINLNFEK